jgi:hypothetical protein
MAKLTLETCKAPSYADYPKLTKIGADKLMAEARQLKMEIAKLQHELAKLAPRIQAKLEVGLDADTKSVLFEDLLISRRAGYTRRSLDKQWAVKKLIAKGVKREEIDEHTTETVIEPGVALQLLGEEGEE